MGSLHYHAAKVHVTQIKTKITTVSEASVYESAKLSTILMKYMQQPIGIFFYQTNYTISNNAQNYWVSWLHFKKLIYHLQFQMNLRTMFSSRMVLLFFSEEENRTSGE